MTRRTAKTVVFTDLDGSLLDHEHRSPQAARPALERLKQEGVPIVFCSAKTRAEQEVYRRALGIGDPFIVENGGAAFIPQGYFPFQFDDDRLIDHYHLIEWGAPYPEIRRVLARIRAELRVDFLGFGDLRAEEVAQVTGLELSWAIRAQAREYDETLLLGDLPRDQRERVLREIERRGLRWSHGGRFYHAMGANDKGRAALRLTQLFKRKYGRIRTVGLGDSQNDAPLLSVVDVPVLLEKPDGRWEPLDLPDLRRVKGSGPVGWRRAIEALVL